MYKGIFWLKHGEFITVKVRCDIMGNALEPCSFSSKSGESFNHKAEWERFPRQITEGVPFDYHPRGRVEVKNGRVTVWLNPLLGSSDYIIRLKKEFEIGEDCLTEVKPDNSKHYECRHYECGKDEE